MPLHAVHEVVSIWPNDPASQNKLHVIFAAGQEAGSSLKIDLPPMTTAWSASFSQSLTFQITSDEPKTGVRMDEDAYKLMKAFLLLHDSCSGRILESLTSEWPDEDYAHVITALAAQNVLPTGPTRRPRPDHGRPWLPRSSGDWCLVQLRAFLLGYYYGIFGKMVDSPTLQVKEAFGSWGWNNRNNPKTIRNLVKSRRKERNRKSERF